VARNTPTQVSGSEAINAAEKKAASHLIPKKLSGVLVWPDDFLKVCMQALDQFEKLWRGHIIPDDVWEMEHTKSPFDPAAMAEKVNFLLEKYGLKALSYWLTPSLRQILKNKTLLVEEIIKLKEFELITIVSALDVFSVHDISESEFKTLKGRFFIGLVFTLTNSHKFLRPQTRGPRRYRTTESRPKHAKRPTLKDIRAEFEREGHLTHNKDF
jgi:hypothetical protein